MHDPLVVAATLRRPWPQRSTSYDARPGRPRWHARFDTPGWTLAGRGWYWPSLITIWHVEPGGHDAGEVCRHHNRVQLPDGTWTYQFLHGWRWHIHHWRIQLHPAQRWRRRLLTRCEWCKGRSRTGDQVNHSNGNGRHKTPWWRGEAGLYHRDCSAIAAAHRTCVCVNPVHSQQMAGSSYGHCARCNKYRGWGISSERLVRLQLLAAIPAGRRERILPATLRAHPDTIVALLRQVTPTTPPPPWRPTPLALLAGIPVVADSTLPPGGWRLLDHTGRTLREYAPRPAGWRNVLRSVAATAFRRRGASHGR